MRSGFRDCRGAVRIDVPMMICLSCISSCTFLILFGEFTALLSIMYASLLYSCLHR